MSTASEHWYLVVRDGENGTTSVMPYSSSDGAFGAYVAAERSVEPEVTEVVLIRAESQEALRAAYPHYFVEGTRDQRVRRFIAGLDALPA